MKKRYVVLLLAAIVLSMSAVSAADNLSVSDAPLEMDNVEEVPLDNVMSEVNHDADRLESSDEPDMIASSNESSDDSSKDAEVQVPSKATTKDIKSTYGTEAEYTLKLLDKSGKIIVGKKVTFKVNDESYKITTDSNGVDLKDKNTYTVSNKVTTKILKWGNKGDVSKIKLLKKNMPNNKWVKWAVKATKKGNPLLKFQGGEGKIVFLTAGVHGNELSSQVAAMKLIKYLSKNPIKGTVYIIPFVNIKAISNKVRHTGVDYNRVANKAGTISNKIVKLVSKYNCDAYGDFHTTQPGGIPGKNIVMGSKSPATKCKEMTKYIASQAKVNKRIYKYAGEQYPGALADNVNKNGIPGVICEVMLPHNTVTTKTVKTSYAMMKALLRFNSVI